jgi:hypothetical protein
MLESLTQTCYVGVLAFIMFVGIPLIIEQSQKNLRKHH